MENIEKTLNEVVEILKMTVELDHELQKTQGDMIVESEKRVGNVNSMVDHLSSLIDRLETTYDYHLKELEQSRNKLIEENCILIKQNARMMNKIDKLEEKCAKTHREYMDYLKHLAGQHTNNVNVYKER